MGIKTIRTRTTRYIDEDNNFEYTFEPVEDSMTITETAEGFEARYLVQDIDAQLPEDYTDDAESGAIFLVHYHRQFFIENKKYIAEDDLRDFYQGQKIEQQKDFWIFPVSAYIHGGVALSLLPGNWNPFDAQGWDTSHVGAVLVSKKAEKKWRLSKNAYKAAESLIERWNQCLSGDVYGIVKETYDKDKNQIDQDAVWGFYGYKYALEALKTEI